VLKDPNANTVPIVTSSIAWDSDTASGVFVNGEPSNQWYDVTNQEFMNWVRLSPTSTIIKLWGVIQ